MSSYDKDILVLEADGAGYYLSGVILDEDDWFEDLNLRGKRLDRAKAETDERFKQIIPYVVVGTRGQDGTIQHLLAAQRLKGGNEARLHGAITVGFGGHVPWQPERTPSEMLLDTVQRELMEELGIDAANYPIYLWGELSNTLDAVGRVHTGVVFFLDLTGIEVERMIQIRTPEPDNLALFWTTPGLIADHKDQLEAWAKLTLHLLPTLPEITG